MFLLVSIRQDHELDVPAWMMIVMLRLLTFFRVVTIESNCCCSLDMLIGVAQTLSAEHHSALIINRGLVTTTLIAA